MATAVGGPVDPAGAASLGTPAPAPQATPAFVVQDPITPATVPITTPVPLNPVAPVADATPSTPPTGGGSGLAPGAAALVTAPNGLNLRQTASSAGTLIIQLATGKTVTVLEGPSQADGFTWWRVDAGDGQSGWVAQGDSETVWLTPASGATAPVRANAQPVDRTPRVGERVVVNQAAGELSVRTTPGVDSTLITRVGAGTQYTVLAGPQQADELTWFQVRSDDGSILGWAAEGDGTIRWLSPLE
jgi:uncharacterized protein YgiM (DUF1202 family)